MSDINELFDRDPLDLTRDDISQIITAYRDMRYKFNQGDSKAGNIKAKPSKNAKAQKLAQTLDIEL